MTEELEANPDRRRARGHVLRYGRDVVAFQGLGSECQYWFDDEPPIGTGACVAYADTGSAWVAAGSPLCDLAHASTAATRFAAAARGAGRRACFFCAERPDQLPGFTASLLGEQPAFDPARWPATVASNRRLREQLRRSRAKGVQVRRVEATALAEGSPLRTAVDAIATAWLRAHHLEPMGFVVALQPWLFAADRRYYAAERDGRVVAFMALVPVPARRGWLVETTVRDRDAPNGTTELLLDLAIRDAADAAFVSLGLAPLSGPISAGLRCARAVGAPLYDFRSLRAFKQRLHPSRWEAVWLVHPRRRRWIALLDSLRAFARGSILRFGVRSILRHPSGLPWLLAVPLVPWTLLLAALVGLDAGAVLGFARPALVAWVVWDALLAILLFRAARRPRRRHLGWLTAAAALDAVLSITHVVRVGLGGGAVTAAVRLAGLVAPIFGTVALAWAASRAPPTARAPAR